MLVRPSLRTPRAAAIAGIAFAVLLATSLILLRIVVVDDLSRVPDWLDDRFRRGMVVLALNLVPFAGLAFLWFIGVVRDRIGTAEDRFFSTVFFGTGLLFVAMLFASGAVAGALIVTESKRGVEELTPELWRFGRNTGFILLNVYAIRMAGAFAIATTTICVRLGIVPKWLAIYGLLTALLLLFTSEQWAWIQLAFPLWVFVLSIYFLIRPPGRTEPD